MRARVFAAFVSLACIAGSSQALAQSTYGDDCSELDDTSPEIVTACAKSLLNRQSLLNTSTSINNTILNRFDIGPNQTEPAGLELTNPEEIADRLSEGRSILIAPTADVAAPVANPKWNIWIDGKYSWQDEQTLLPILTVR